MRNDVSNSLSTVAPLRGLSWGVGALMVVAMIYVGWLSISSWTDIAA